MSPIFPAILLCGPPHSGKSTLLYRLSHALRQHHIEHYALRASPDGEGDWMHEADPALVRVLRMQNKAAWTPEFARQIAREIDRRWLPLLVDTGGQITPESARIVASCTHGIVLSNDPEQIPAWRSLLHEQGCVVLAELHSQQDGDQTVEPRVRGTPLRGTITGLQAGNSSDGACFQQLLALIIAHMNYDPHDLFRAHEAAAHVDLVLHLGQPLLPQHTAAPIRWQPADLPELLGTTLDTEPLALYGRAPNWLYAALAAYTLPEPQIFTPTRGWVYPPRVQEAATPDRARLDWAIRTTSDRDLVHFSFSITDAYLDYDDPDPLLIPRPPTDSGLILSGKLPNWLYAALARHYRHVPWLAVYQPEVGAVVIRSQHPTHPIGRVLRLADISS